MIQQLNGFGSQWQEADLAAFAVHPDLRLGQQEIIAIQIQHFLGPEALQQH
jgi:hypothetical protein